MGLLKLVTWLAFLLFVLLMVVSQSDGNRRPASRSSSSSTSRRRPSSSSGRRPSSSSSSGRRPSSSSSSGRRPSSSTSSSRRRPSSSSSSSSGRRPSSSLPAGRGSSSSSRNRQRGSRARTTTTCRGRTTFSMTAANLGQRPFNFRCPNGPVAEVKAVGVKGNCRGYSPLLLSTVDRCTWNATCTIPFIASPIETRAASTTGDSSCLGQQPESFEISYACAKRNADVKSLLGQLQSTNKRTGIVKSHRLYPWSYRSGDQVGNLTLVRPRAGYTTLWITVRTMTVLDSDLLFLSWNEIRRRGQQDREEELRQITPSDTTFDVQNVTRVVLTFYVDYAQSHSGSGKDHGFLLCYQWLRPTARLKKGSACTRVLQSAKCKSRSSRNRPRTRPGSSGTSSRTRTRTRTSSRRP